MTTKNKCIITFISLFILLCIIIGVIIYSQIDSNKKINNFKGILNSKEPQIIYISRPTCYYCNLIEPITDELKERYDLTYNNINIDDLSTSQIKKILKLINQDITTFGTPYIAVVQNGKIIKEQNGYTEEDILFDMFKKTGLIKVTEKLPLNYLNYEEYKEIKNKDGLVLLGTSANTKVIEAKNILNKISEENDIEINYFDLSKIDNESEYNNILLEFEITDKDLPLFLIVKDGKITVERDITKEKLLDSLN